jgi:hypothetical protein
MLFGTKSPAYYPRVLKVSASTSLTFWLVLACSNQGALAARTASSELPCPREGLTVQELEDDRYRVIGCGQNRIYECVDDNCWREGRFAEKARQRAAREFGCSGGRVAVRWIQGDTFRVEACGQGATYECDDDNGCMPEGARPVAPTAIAIPMPIIAR